jgi:hypothetical protein
VQNKNGGTEELYACAKKRKGCPAEIVLDTDIYVKESQKEHSHFGSIYEVAKAQIYSKAKKMIRIDPKRGVDEIITEVLRNYPDAVQRRVKRKNLERVLYHTNDVLLNHPKGPTTPEELIIPEEWSIFPDGEPYVIGDLVLARTPRASAERMILFTHPRNLRWLSECSVVAGDGTFAMRFPPQAEWRQLYIIHGHVRDTFIPLVGIASNSSTGRMYASSLTYLRDYMHQVMGIDWKPSVFLSDFEASVISALPRVFTHGGFQHKGCWFHFSQAIMKRVKSAGLQKAYSKDTELRAFVDKLRYMALVPFFSIARCFTTLIDGRNREVTDLFTKYPALHTLVYDYYLPTWLGANRRKPVFSPTMWNHGRIDEVPHDFDPADPHPNLVAVGQIDHPLTTNSLESAHRTLNAIGNKHGKRFWHIWIDVREFIGSSQLQIDLSEIAIAYI